MMSMGHIARAMAVVLAVGGLAAAPITQAAVLAVEPAPLRAETEPAALVRVEPAVLWVEPGGVVTASIVITGVAGLYGADARLTFDPQLVQVVDMDAGALGVQIAPGPLLTTQGSPFIVLNSANNLSGSASFAATMVNPSIPITGGGVLYLVQFRGVLTGVVPLAFSYAELSTRTGGTLARTTENGQIQVGAVNLMWLPLLWR